MGDSFTQDELNMFLTKLEKDEEEKRAGIQEIADHLFTEKEDEMRDSFRKEKPNVSFSNLTESERREVEMFSDKFEEQEKREKARKEEVAEEYKKIKEILYKLIIAVEYMTPLIDQGTCATCANKKECRYAAKAGEPLRINCFNYLDPKDCQYDHEEELSPRDKEIRDAYFKNMGLKFEKED